jgi:hypothetical protein
MIKVKCTRCGEVIQIRAVKLEKRIAELEEELRDIKSYLNKPRVDAPDFFKDIFGGKI